MMIVLLLISNVWIMSKLAASGDIECGWDDKTNNMTFWPKEKTKE
jgi:hypothetical protein